MSMMLHARVYLANSGGKGGRSMSERARREDWGDFAKMLRGPWPSRSLTQQHAQRASGRGTGAWCPGMHASGGLVKGASRRGRRVG